MSARVAASEASMDELHQTPLFDSPSSDEIEQSEIRLQEDSLQESDSDENMEGARSSSSIENVKVVVPAPARPWEYQKLQHNSTVDTVLEEIRRPEGKVWYRVAFEDGREDDVPFEQLIALRNGENALNNYLDGEDGSSESEIVVKTPSHLGEQATMTSVGKRARTKSGNQSLTRRAKTGSASEEENEEGLSTNQTHHKRRMLSRGRGLLVSTYERQRSTRSSGQASTVSPDEESSEDDTRPARNVVRHVTRGIQPTRGNRTANGRVTRSSGLKSYQQLSYKERILGDDSEEADELAIDGLRSNDEIKYTERRSTSSSLVNGRSRGRGRGRGRGRQVSRDLSRRSHPHASHDTSASSSERPEPTRRSGRTTKATKSMKEHLEDEEIYADEPDATSGPKVMSIRETFQPLPAKSSFRLIHHSKCDVCNGLEFASNKGPSPLIYCQGCTTSIHKVCLGYRSSREHMVTKVGEDNFVMQCRRCIGVATRKDYNAPHLDMCQVCKKLGNACEAFSQKKTSKQEEKMREENGGADPITAVDPDLINNATIVLFRCSSCQQGFHFEHLPPLDGELEIPGAVESLRALRFAEYSQAWQCKDCQTAPAKVQGLVAWRPTNIDTYQSGHTVDQVNEDEKEYLIKWENLSHFRCTWMPGSWIWGVTATVMRTAFARRGEGANLLPKMNEEDAIPEEFKRVEIVLDVEYSSKVSTHTEEIDKARVKEVENTFVKYQGLGYDEVVWERPPSPNETDRWADFVAAYNEYVAGKYFKQVSQNKMKERIREYRELNFEKKILMTRQPASVVGGEMMAYQMEGLNWLLYNFHQEKNVVLADEMGLGKTIQVIATLAALVKDKPKCWPFLVVVPNSTCPNWRREIKKWAPSLRVVAYYGVRAARDVAMEYELFPNGCSDLKAHVVITSYEAPVEDHTFFHKIKWAGLIVDEGQRLKNDKNLLYSALTNLNVPFRVLLTGTPLQNNKRELFNLLQFLDNSNDAAKLDEKYAELTNENLPELHELIRPYFLRRTKAQVLKFLPPMAQVIVPVTMTVVQKKLYKSILSKSPELIKSIFVKDQTRLRPSERGSLNNILIQLRKCLCHPFVYSEAIEERSVNSAVLHRNLVDAASKLQLLEIMLPKLQERGHRVLIFSQFLKQLDIIEDFLVGLGLQFQRLDGNVGTLEKQKRIDAFNAPDSPLFAFLLSTRAGGVGINLATADTVIIMDPDFNPHQDIQALSRAHRIGQKKKVLVFQLMTKDSAEEKIVQIGRKKMALDHVLIESMDADDDAGVDVQSILRHGAEALFNDDDQHDIKYDSTAVDKLLDRSQIENTNIGDDKSAESQFSFARIWANDAGTLTDDVGDADSDAPAVNPTLWDKILKQREADAAREKAAQQTLFGRGRRVKQSVDYQRSNMGPDDDVIMPASSPVNQKILQEVRTNDSDFSNTQESEGDVDSEPDSAEIDPMELQLHEDRQGGIQTADPLSPQQAKQVESFRRVKIVRPVHYGNFVNGTRGENGPASTQDPQDPQDPLQPKLCHACGDNHVTGYCPLKRAGIEHCGLCGLAHFGASKRRICPHLKSETQVRLMLDALKTSPEPREYIELARSYLRGVVGDLVRRKKAAEGKHVFANAAAVQPVPQGPPTSITPTSTPTYINSPYTNFTPAVPYRNTLDQNSHPI